MKICALICSHSDPVYTKLTVKSLLKNVGKNNDITVHIGVHSNYDDYTRDFSLFKEFEKICQFHMVEEIDWIAHNEDVYRYSKMHAKNLENLLKHVRYYDFDYLLILDNDLYIKEDFMEAFVNGEDIVGSLSEDMDYVKTWRDSFGELIDFMPKLSVWNLILSRKAYDEIIKNIKLIYPEIVNPLEYGVTTENRLYFDTFAKIYFFAEKWGLKKKILRDETFTTCIEHFSGSSWNYGSRCRGENLSELTKQVEIIYNKNFP